jgi:hypothetical protein
MEITMTFRRFFMPWRTYTRTFRGDCTVWHDVETGKRPGTMTEMRLCELWWLRTQPEIKAREIPDGQ